MLALPSPPPPSHLTPPLAPSSCHPRCRRRRTFHRFHRYVRPAVACEARVRPRTAWKGPRSGSGLGRLARGSTVIDRGMRKRGWDWAGSVGSHPGDAVRASEAPIVRFGFGLGSFQTVTRPLRETRDSTCVRLIGVIKRWYWWIMTVKVKGEQRGGSILRWTLSYPIG